MKKKFMVYAALALCISGVLMVTGCGAPKQKKEKKGKAPYEVSIEKVFTCGSLNGDVLVVNLDVKNLSEEYLDAYSPAYDLTAKLDGTSLEGGTLFGENPNAINLDDKIASGETGKSQAVFKLDKDAKGEVSLLGVTYDREGGGDVEVLKETVKLSEVERVVSESMYDLTVDNVVATDDGDGNSIVVLDMTFTNNSEETTSFGSSIDLEIFQNSIGLKSGYLPSRHPSYDEALEQNTYLDIQKGAAIQVRKVYNLNDAAQPIQVKAVDSMSYDGAPIIEKEILLK